jgi:hypothetical protein
MLICKQYPSQPHPNKEHKIMATSSTKTNTTVPDLEAAAERVREANERLLDASRKISTAYLDGVEKYVSELVQFERKVAEQSQVDGLASVLGAHADLTEEITKASVSTTRELIAA